MGLYCVPQMHLSWGEEVKGEARKNGKLTSVNEITLVHVPPVMNE